MNNFQIISKVGQGAFASVYKIKRKQDGGIYALKKIKIVDGSTRDIGNCLNEVRILASINNPYIIKYKQAIYDETIGSILLITQFANGGDLSTFIKSYQKKKQKIAQNQIWRFAIQMIYALKALHKANIFHRDVKSANILLTENNQQIKLADLNVSKITKSGLAITQTGTPYYASPQVWSDLPYSGKCDIWSLGCVLYEMATFRPPFLASDIVSLKKKISEGKFDRIPDKYSQDLQSFIRLCLSTNHKDRPTSEALIHNSLIRKRLYMFPNQKFNQSSFDEIANKQNKLLQTIKISRKSSLKNDFKISLPKSNYQNELQNFIENDSNRYCSLHKSQITQRLPKILKINSSKQTTKQNFSPPKNRLIYLR